MLAGLTVIAQWQCLRDGSIVRVSQSELGCPTWPSARPAGSLVPIAHPLLGQVHQWIEFPQHTTTNGAAEADVYRVATHACDALVRQIRQAVESAGPPDTSAEPASDSAFRSDGSEPGGTSAVPVGAGGGSGGCT